ncbi:MAG: pyruvate formate lyase family protein, partial [Thermodesulfobacteriota bacterium]|nr:pyruvate formate lyase family protein [Thermodesulfobacteriota bacterium]
IALLYHDKLSEEFLLKCVELIRTGMGQPSFHDVKKSIQRNLYLHDGITLEEARNSVVVPCVQTVIAGYSDNFWEGHLNVAKMLELALNNGRDPLTGVLVGPENGGIQSLQTYDKFYHAVLEQLEYFIRILRNTGRVAWNVIRDFPIPFGSSFTHDCIEKGKDASDGGARYPSALGISFVGMVDLANSLASIKKLVFEENKVTLEQLRDALDANFEGYEELHKMCLDAPKYGNGDDQTDSIIESLYKMCGAEVKKLPDFQGRKIQPEAYSVTTHGGRGELTGALPSGRKARVALTDASVSAQPGTDRSGPTALIRSAARAVDNVEYACNHFNMKLHPTALKGPEGARKFLSLIKTYMDMGGYHIQFNCVNSETLKDAQLHPDEYKNLIVRVAGFSAYFVTLEKVIQEEIIERTELSL